MLDGTLDFVQIQPQDVEKNSIHFNSSFCIPYSDDECMNGFVFGSEKNFFPTDVFPFAIL